LSRFYYTLLILIIGAAACGPSATEPQQEQMRRHLSTANPRVVDGPTTEPKIAVSSSIAAPTATPGSVPGSTDLAVIPSPTPVAAAAPTKRPEPTATPAPRPTPTPAATSVPVSPEDRERQESFFEDFKSISYEAFLEVPSVFTECGCPVTAYVSGWMAAGGASQMFAEIEMTEPVERSVEVVTRNSFDVFLKDLDEGRWYFIPENSDTDAGPLEDIMSLPFLALGFSVVPAGELEPVQDGYLWKIEDPSWGALTATYDLGRILTGITRADPEGREILQVSFFDLYETHDIIPHQKGELLPETYWERQ